MEINNEIVQVESIDSKVDTNKNENPNGLHDADLRKDG